MSSDVEIHLDLSLVSSSSSQITLYKSLHACQQSILKSTYLDFLLIITSVEASCILLEKELDVIGLNMYIWKTE